MEYNDRLSRRARQSSSLSDMFPEETVAPSHSEHRNMDKLKSGVLEPKALSLREEQLKIQGIALRLRRAKRSLLLSAASEERPFSPAEHAEQFRTIAMHLSDLDLGIDRSELSGAGPVGIYRTRAGSVTSSGSK